MKIRLLVRAHPKKKDTVIMYLKYNFQVVTVAKEDLRAEVGVCERSGSTIFVGDDHITLSCSERCGGVFLKVFLFSNHVCIYTVRTHTHSHTYTPKQTQCVVIFFRRVGFRHVGLFFSKQRVQGLKRKKTERRRRKP